MKSRILVAVVGIPALLYVVLAAPPFVMMVALMILAGIGGGELLRCTGGGERRDPMGVSALLPLLTVSWYYQNPEAVPLFWILYGLFLCVLAIVKGGEIKYSLLMSAIFGGIFIGYSFSSFLRLEAGGIHRAYLLLPFILSFASDTFAFFTGLTLGKHKLAPKVSPKKTIEGSVGGLAGNVLCGLLFVWVMDRFFGGSLIGYGPMALLALFCGAVAQIGDLSFSLIKREFGIKDYGHLFLAHGGVLDRFDSVLFVAPVIEIIFSFL